jgi:hypothetical protein
MIKKWNEFINENEFTKLGAYFMRNIDKEFNFTSPNDNVRIEQITITLPDNVKVTFDTNENLYSDTETFTLNGVDNRLISSYQMKDYIIINEYLKLYGNKIQFDNYNIYKRIRLYMNIEDLYDTKFDGYIYNPDKKGSNEIEIEIKDNSSRIKNNSFMKNDYIYPFIKGANLICNKIKGISNFISDRYSVANHLLKELENKDENIIIQNDYPLLGYFYLYTVLINKDKDILNLLENINNYKSKEEIINLLYY